MLANLDAIHRATRQLGGLHQQAAQDARILDRIARLMDQRIWSPDTLDDIAELIRQSGRTVGEVAEDLDDYEIHVMVNAGACSVSVTGQAQAVLAEANDLSEAEAAEWVSKWIRAEFPDPKSAAAKSTGVPGMWVVDPAPAPSRTAFDPGGSLPTSL